jgi:hypothetical protein
MEEFVLWILLFKAELYWIKYTWEKNNNT